MRPPPEIFDPGKTHCPSCNATLPSPVVRCGFCGFTAEICMRRFPFEPPPLQRFVDPDDSITDAEQRVMTKAIQKFEKRFPQIEMSVCVMRLPEGVDGREFGFWYLNRSRPKSPEARIARPHHILLIIDQTTRTLSATVGYGLDCFLDDVTLYDSLDKAEPSFSRGGYAKGIAQWLKILGKKMVDIHEEAVFALDRWERHHRSTSGSSSRIPATPRAAATQGYHDSSKAPPTTATVQRHVATSDAESVLSP